MREAEATASASVDADRARIDAELLEFRGARDGKPPKCRGSLLARYDRIQQRERSVALYALRDQSCGHCDR